MLQAFFKILTRKLFYRKTFGCRKVLLILLPLLVLFFFVWITSSWLIMIISWVLQPPPSQELSLTHFRRNRYLANFMNHIQLVVEPSALPCSNTDDIPVIILVTSSPHDFEQRQAVRETWGKHHPTYFVLGLEGGNVDERKVLNYVESKQFDDLIIFGFQDNYQNLTIKTALAMNWTLARCPQAKYLLKTDDDVLVNPWTLKAVLKENPDAQLIGYKHINIPVHRDEYDKWYMPRWMYSLDVAPQYLAGPAYIINGKYLQKILVQAYKVPLLNLEDIYYTYIVAHKTLGLSLTHDRRLNPKRPLLDVACAYASLATAHSFSPDEMVTAWIKITRIDYSNNHSCAFYKKYLDNEWFLYYKFH